MLKRPHGQKKYALVFVLLFIITTSAQAGLVPISDKYAGGAKNMCKTCIQCVDTEGEEQKSCECLPPRLPS